MRLLWADTVYCFDSLLSFTHTRYTLCAHCSAVSAVVHLCIASIKQNYYVVVISP
jgi:hypothetical protein